MNVVTLKRYVVSMLDSDTRAVGRVFGCFYGVMSVTHFIGGEYIKVRNFALPLSYVVCFLAVFVAPKELYELRWVLIEIGNSSKGVGFMLFQILVRRDMFSHISKGFRRYPYQ